MKTPLKIVDKKEKCLYTFLITWFACADVPFFTYRAQRGNKEHSSVTLYDEKTTSHFSEKG
ncbi:hypothetical protein HMPREF3033_00637 [Veillonellaceae bacterium DNF00751]|nr:hypothetical protein HMPREF3033_00637 [Veillonellaceae bacterium DNF00751]